MSRQPRTLCFSLPSLAANYSQLVTTIRVLRKPACRTIE
ncbi:hypothetical protein ABID19_002631 [Mesorhizobium robiniae]|uniref:Uncharacterized protein n=1 Tax=Mesorhizobium robiniae TaxID=559315 RepID=A0ABV2GMS7_9HYPH